MFRMGLAFAKQRMQSAFVMHVWDSSVVDHTDLGVLNLLRNKVTYYERFGFVHQDQAALRQAVRKAAHLASQSMKQVLQACLDIQAHVSRLQNGLQSLVDRVVRAVGRARCSTFGQFVWSARLACIRDVFEVSDFVGAGSTFFGLLFDLKRSYPSQLYLVVD